MKWLSTIDNEPPKYVSILISDGDRITIARWDGESFIEKGLKLQRQVDNMLFTFNIDLSWQVRYWMPLPESPNAEREG